MGVEGLENAAETRGKLATEKKLTQNPTHDRLELRLLMVFRSLTLSAQEQMVERLERELRDRGQYFDGRPV